MLTILSTPKAFTGLFAVIQRNAIESWTRLEPRPEIILFGRDSGTAELCEELGLRHVPDVATNAQGTPLLSDMFITGQAMATHPVVCWANADIIFTATIMRAAQVVNDHPRTAYLVGRRTDLDQLTPLDLSDGWADALAARAALEGERKPANWIDYFMFTRGLFGDLPPFAIGRPGYDPWLIWRAADLGADVVDATDYVLAVHQRHDYSHVGSRAVAFGGVEAKQNAAIVDDWRHYHSIAHALLKLDHDGALVPAREARTGWRARGVRRAPLALHAPAPTPTARGAGHPSAYGGRRDRRGHEFVNPVAVVTDDASGSVDPVVGDPKVDAITLVDAPIAARARERHRRVAVTTASAIGPKLLSLAVLLVGARFVARALPPDGFGVWLLLITASGLLGFADLGLGNGLLNEVASADGREDLGAQRRAISSASTALLLMATILVGVFVLTIPFVQWSQLLDVQGRSAGSVTAAVAVFVVGTALAVAFGAAPRVRLALQTGWVNNAWGAAGGVISLSAVVIGALCGASLPVLVGAALVGPPLVAAADTVVLFGFQRPELRPHRQWIRRAEVTRLGRQGAMFCFLAVAIAVGYESDALVISHELGASAVPQFALPYRILMLAPAAVSLVTVALWPAYAEAVARGDLAWAEHTLKRSLVFAVAGTALASLVVVAVGPMVWSWLTDTGAVPTRGLLLVLGLLACVMSASTALGVFLSATGRLRIQVVAAALVAATNLPLSIALVGPLGVVGPAWGTIITQIVFVLVPVGFVIGRALHRRGSSSAVFAASGAAFRSEVIAP